MHGARRLRCIGPPGILGDAKGIHIGAQSNGAVWRAPAKAAHDTGSAHPFDHIKSKPAQSLRDKGRGAVLFKPKFRMPMQIMPPCGQLGF